MVKNLSCISYLYPDKRCLIGNGVVVDPDVLLEEIEGLSERGIKVGPERLGISERAHLIMPYHRAIDIAREIGRASEHISSCRTTGPLI